MATHLIDRRKQLAVAAATLTGAALAAGCNARPNHHYRNPEQIAASCQVPKGATQLGETISASVTTPKGNQEITATKFSVGAYKRQGALIVVTNPVFGVLVSGESSSSGANKEDYKRLCAYAPLDRAGSFLGYDPGLEEQWKCQGGWPDQRSGPDRWNGRVVISNADAPPGPMPKREITCINR